MVQPEECAAAHQCGLKTAPVEIQEFIRTTELRGNERPWADAVNGPREGTVAQVASMSRAHPEVEDVLMPEPEKASEPTPCIPGRGAMEAKCDEGTG